MSGWWVYLAVGVGGLAIMLLVSYWRGRSTRSSALMRVLQAPKSRREWLVDKVLVPSIAGVAVVVAWPAVGVWAARELWMDRQREQERIKRQEEGVFMIRTGDLLQATTIAEVEKTERIRDPLGAVPDLPFGHLHAVWREFLQERPHDAELWTFACDWTTEWGTVFARRGYVWVEDQACTPWMLTSHTPKEEDDD